MKFGKNLTNAELQLILRNMAAAYELLGENTFRIQAYENAADSVEHASREVKDIFEDGKLEELPGVGKNLSAHLQELFTTGKVKHFSKVLGKIPQAVFALLEIPGIGPKTAQKLVKFLKLTTAKTVVTKLKQAAEAGKIRTIPGFGPDSETAILRNIGELERREDRLLLADADRIGGRIITYLKSHPAVIRVDLLGSLRRRCPTVGDIDLAVATVAPKAVLDYVRHYPEAKNLLALGENTARLILKNNRQIDIKTEPQNSYGTLLAHFTGSKNHNVKLRQLAQQRGMSISEHGVKIKGKIFRFHDEKSFYAKMGMDFIPPELRENEGEIEAGLTHNLPALVEARQIKGDLHLHTDYPWYSSHDSGANGIGAILNQGLALDYQYLGLTDHNPSLSRYSSKEIITEIKKRNEIIDKHIYSYFKSHNHKKLTIFKGLEVDILVDGQLAVGDAALELVDYAIVSVHSSFRLSREDMTNRVIRGLSHPKAKILGHPTGRLLNSREGYEIDWDRLLSFCATNNKYLEINSQANRLDLPDSLVRQAIGFGVKLAINSDAHQLAQMDNLTYGIAVARRGWATKQDIINTGSLSQLKTSLNLSERG